MVQDCEGRLVFRALLCSACSVCSVYGLRINDYYPSSSFSSSLFSFMHASRKGGWMDWAGLDGGNIPAPNAPTQKTTENADRCGNGKETPTGTSPLYLYHGDSATPGDSCSGIFVAVFSLRAPRPVYPENKSLNSTRVSIYPTPETTTLSSLSSLPSHSPLSPESTESHEAQNANFAIGSVGQGQQSCLHWGSREKAITMLQLKSNCYFTSCARIRVCKALEYY